MKLIVLMMKKLMLTPLLRSIKLKSTILLFFVFPLISVADKPVKLVRSNSRTNVSDVVNRYTVGPEFFVSPTGLPTGDGSSAHPWDLQTALNQPAAVVPGSTICMEAGTYHGNFTSELRGTAANPIVVRNCSGGRVVIDGSRAGQTLKNVTNLVINGEYTWFWGMEITNSDPERILTQSGSNPPERRGAGIAVFARGIKLINLLVYDNGEGIDAWTPAEDCEVYGNVVFNNGWYAPDREHGHGIYTQNNTGTKKFIDNIVLNNFSYAWQVFGSSAASLKNYYIEGNTVFNDRWLIGGAAAMENIELVNNFTYRDTLQIGYFTNVINNNLVLRNNYFASLLKVYYWNNVKAYSNTFFTGSSYNYPVLFSFAGLADFSTFQFDSNTYYWSTPPPAFQNEVGLGWENSNIPDNDPGQNGLYLLSQWQAMGQDQHATIQNWPQKDANNIDLNGSKVFLRQNKYDPKRATLTIYNWDEADNVDIDPGTVLAVGDNYELHNVQDYFGDVIRGVYGGGMLRVPMTNHTVAKPLGYDIEQGPNTFKEFGSFLLINTGAAASLPVKFLEFDASPVNQNVKLNWSTSEEQNIKYFCVQRSVDGVHYDSIGVQSSSRNPQSVNHYQFVDRTPGQGENYYRIKEVDLDNRLVYSQVQIVKYKISGFSYFILGNPVNNQLKLNLRFEVASKISLEVRSVTGQLYIRQDASYNSGSFKKDISINHLPGGTYFITISAGSKKVTQSFIKP